VDTEGYERESRLGTVSEALAITSGIDRLVAPFLVQQAKWQPPEFSVEAIDTTRTDETT
jgi:hypothetical protein